MTTTYKLYTAANTDGAVYIDLPISGRIVGIDFVLGLTAGAGGVAAATAELSRVAVNQIATSNPRGVIASAYLQTSAASTGASANVQVVRDEPIKSGERLYLNTAGAAANVAFFNATAYVTIV